MTTILAFLAGCLVGFAACVALVLGLYGWAQRVTGRTATPAPAAEPATDDEPASQWADALFALPDVEQLSWWTPEDGDCQLWTTHGGQTIETRGVDLDEAAAAAYFVVAGAQS